MRYVQVRIFPVNKQYKKKLPQKDPPDDTSQFHDQISEKPAIFLSASYAAFTWSILVRFSKHQIGNTHTPL